MEQKLLTLKVQQIKFKIKQNLLKLFQVKIEQIELIIEWLMLTVKIELIKLKIEQMLLTIVC